MDFNKLIKDAKIEYSNNEIAFFAFIAYQLLEQSTIFSLLDCAAVIKTNLFTIIENQKKTKHKASDDGKLSFEEKLERLCSAQRQILSCPQNDEHVLLLSSLKALLNLLNISVCM